MDSERASERASEREKERPRARRKEGREWSSLDKKMEDRNAALLVLVYSSLSIVRDEYLASIASIVSSICPRRLTVLVMKASIVLRSTLERRGYRIRRYLRRDIKVPLLLASKYVHDIAETAMRAATSRRKYRDIRPGDVIAALLDLIIRISPTRSPVDASELASPSRYAIAIRDETTCPPLRRISADCIIKMRLKKRADVGRIDLRGETLDKEIVTNELARPPETSIARREIRRRLPSPSLPSSSSSPHPLGRRV